MSALLSILAAASAPSNPSTSDCRVLIVARQAGEIVEEGDTKAAPCPEGARPRRLRFDARRAAVVAGEPLAEGDDLGHVYFPVRPAVRAGDRIKVVAHIGHVSITREATALQPARAGQHFFARADDGNILVAPRIAEGTDR